MSTKQDNIFRKAKSPEHPYSMIANTAIRDSRLSWKARGVLVYILSMPNDWTIWQSELANHSEQDGRESLETAIDELKEHGYITVEVERDEMGRIQRFAYEVHEEPVEVDEKVLLKLEQKREKKKARAKRKQEKLQEQETGIPLMGENISSPLTGKPQTVKPLTVNPQLLKTNFTNDLASLSTDEIHTESKAQAPVCVDQENEKIEKIKQKAKDAIGITVQREEIKKWLTAHDEAYILDKIALIASQGTTNAHRSLRDAIKSNWQWDTTPTDKKTSTRASEQSSGASSVQRVVPAVQPGKYERFYQVYGQTGQNKAN